MWSIEAIQIDLGGDKSRKYIQHKKYFFYFDDPTPLHASFLSQLLYCVISSVFPTIFESMK